MATKSKTFKRCATLGLGLGLLALLAGWAYSHVDPATLGTCHKLALYVGKQPFVEDCEPFASGDFAAAAAVLGFLLLFVSGLSGSVKTPFGTFRWEREAEKVREELKVSPGELALRAERAVARSSASKPT